VIRLFQRKSTLRSPLIAPLIVAAALSSAEVIAKIGPTLGIQFSPLSFNLEGFVYLLHARPRAWGLQKEGPRSTSMRPLFTNERSVD